MTIADAPAPTPRWERWFAPALTLIAFFLILIQVATHIMWRDEVRPWQLVRECSNPIQVIQVMRFDAVPALWNLIVWVLTRLTDNPFLMQFVHALIATATIYVFARFSPFSKLIKSIFAFGYYPLFEYAAITRNYALIFLFMLIACVLISRPRVPLVWLTVVLFLLTQVSIWGMGFAGLLMLTALVKIIWSEGLRPRIVQVIVCGLVLAIGAVLCLLEVRPGPGPSFTATWLNATTGQKIEGTFAAVYLGWIPIPAFSPHFWNTNILDPHTGFQAFLGVMLLLCAGVLLVRRPIALGLFLAGMIGLLAFEFYFKGAARHHGHLFMLLICAFWLSWTTPTWELIQPVMAFLERMRNVALLGLLCINALAGIGAMIGGLSMPFSASWATAQYIRQNVDPKIPIVAIDDYCASPVAQWLGRDIFFPQMRKFARVNTQDGAAHAPNVGLEDLIGQIVQISQVHGPNTLLILSYPRGEMFVKTDSQVELNFNGQKRTMRIKVLPSFFDGVVADEGQSLFLINVGGGSPPLGDLRN